MKIQETMMSSSDNFILKTIEFRRLDHTRFLLNSISDISIFVPNISEIIESEIGNNLDYHLSEIFKHPGWQQIDTTILKNLYLAVIQRGIF